jgi:DNA-directed RNA polymerase specialized sigma24 family protein
MAEADPHGDLFGWKPPLGYPDRPGHRNVATSIAAADALAPKLGRLQRMAETTIRTAGVYGLTADELAERLDLSRWTIQPRTSELRRKGLIRDSGQRRPNRTGKLAIVWIAA